MLNISISVMLVMNLLSCELTLFYLPFFRISTWHGMASSSFCGKLGWASKQGTEIVSFCVKRRSVIWKPLLMYIYKIHLMMTYMYISY